MNSFRPPLRKRTAENDENSAVDDSLCSEGNTSIQDSQEILSCGFLPPKQRKRTPFQPPLRDLASPGQNYINRILHEGEENAIKERTPSNTLISSFQLAPLNSINQDDNDDHTTVKSIPRKHHYYYHIGSRRIEQPRTSLSHKKPAMTAGNKQTVSTSHHAADENESRFKIFEFQLSQDVKKANKTSCKPRKNENTVGQVVAMHNFEHVYCC